MTDTTDIKALIDGVCLAAAGIHNLGRSVSDERAQGVIDFIRSKLESAFEAERQRAAGSEEELHKALHREKAAERKLLAAQEEIAALKVEQVPVTFHRVCQVLIDDAWVDVSYGAMENQKKHGVEARILFTAPQKPVVLIDHIKISEVVAAVSLEQNRKWNGRVGYMAGWNACVDAAIAGGIVKDGE